MTQLGSPARQSGPDDSGGRPMVRGSRLARRRRVLLGVGIAAALLAIGGLIGASFVKSPQQLAADTAAPPATVTTATVVSQVLTSSVEMRGVVYPATEYDVYANAPSSSSSSSSDAGSASAAGNSSAGASGSAVYISKLDVAAGDTISNGEELAEIDGQPLFALTGTVPAWRDLTPGESGPDVTELQKALHARHAVPHSARHQAHFRRRSFRNAGERSRHNHGGVQTRHRAARHLWRRLGRGGSDLVAERTIGWIGDGRPVLSRRVVRTMSQTPLRSPGRRL